MNIVMKPAVFVDRDGVINKEVGYISSISQLEIFPYVKECIDEIHRRGYLAIVISNQAAVARGLISEEKLIEINNHIKELTGVDEVYYCPHHIQGIIKKYSKNCDCRKPNTGMIRQAVKINNVDLSKSIIVGDRASDIETGQNVGIKTILVESGYGLSNLEYQVEPDYICEDLRGVLDYI